jgi:predicted RNA binding protein YcfA (HicA-like mRNA interferase family)
MRPEGGRTGPGRMKRRDLVRKLEEIGCTLVRRGGSHKWYTNPATKKS